MRVFLLLIILLPGAALAQASELMLCLGKEEKAFHAEKDTGPIYDLNQKLIGELITIPGIEAPRDVLRKVCRTSGSPSQELLVEMLLNPTGWGIVTDKTTGLEKNIALELIKDLNQSTPEILLGFLAQLQAAAPDAHCLNRHIPGINTLNNEVKWLQEEVDIVKIAGRRKRLKRILLRMKKSKQIFAKCRAEAQSKSKSKKSDKSAGKPSAQ